MLGEYENIAKSFMGSPQGIKVIKTLDRINSISSTENGRQLIAMLAGDGGDAVKTAAKAATVAERDQARVFLSNLLSTKEGAALAAKVIEVMGA